MFNFTKIEFNNFIMCEIIIYGTTFYNYSKKNKSNNAS